VKAPVAAAAAAALVLALALVAFPGGAGADSFTPVRMAITVTPVARRHAKLPVTVTVTADPGALDDRDGPLLVGVKLSPECGGNFETTTGPIVLIRTLSPQPNAGRAYQASVTGFGRPAAYGVQTLCMFLETTNTQRVFANDESNTVNVSKPCTTAGTRYDRANTALRRARRELRHAKRTGQRRGLKRLVAKRLRTLRQDRRRGVAACGRGVAL
jgi:hypothetical protein